ncbi:GIY-YIG nuclease family protein [Fictibacillus sp. UD]|uniref:GIY-YIG nuclease family protein n=1 Tax=Fictibacillus sp. UD TaxID=3038777 RepID=UPI003745D67C
MNSESKALLDFINQIRLNKTPVYQNLIGSKFGTIIQDAYKREDVSSIVDALKDLCSPMNVNMSSRAWASSGIYSFWNYESRELLYIGLAVDFSERFKQHNGIIPTLPSSSKFEYITEYFESNEKLGFSILTMPSLYQPIIRKNFKKIYSGEQVELSDFSDEQFKRDVKIVEGILIQSYKNKFNQLPPWNNIAGYKKGAARCTAGNYKIVEAFTTNNWNHSLLSKCTLRELIDNYHLYYEETLTIVRSHMLTYGTSFVDAMEEILKISNELEYTFNSIVKEKYMDKIPKFT